MRPKIRLSVIFPDESDPSWHLSRKVPSAAPSFPYEAPREDVWRVQKWTHFIVEMTGPELLFYSVRYTHFVYVLEERSTKKSCWHLCDVGCPPHLLLHHPSPTVTCHSPYSLLSSQNTVQ